MAVWHFWFLAGVGFMIWEVFTPGFVVGVIGLACLAGSLASYLGGGATVQVAVFGLMNLIGFIFIRPFFKKVFYRTGERRKLGKEALMGRRARVMEEIDPRTGGGRVQVGGENWKAAGPTGQRIEAGRTVEVVGIEGVTIQVVPVEEE